MFPVLAWRITGTKFPIMTLLRRNPFSIRLEYGRKLKQWKAEVFVYQNHLKDLISNVPSTYNGQDSLDGAKVYKKENVNKASIKGS